MIQTYFQKENSKWKLKNHNFGSRYVVCMSMNLGTIIIYYIIVSIYFESYSYHYVIKSLTNLNGTSTAQEKVEHYLSCKKSLKKPKLLRSYIEKNFKFPLV